VSVCVIHVHNSVVARAELLRGRPVARDPIRPRRAAYYCVNSQNSKQSRKYYFNEKVERRTKK
jgi:hypothetical protein